MYYISIYGYFIPCEVHFSTQECVGGFVLNIVKLLCGWLSVTSACEQDESGLSSDMLVYPLLQGLCIRNHSNSEILIRDPWGHPGDFENIMKCQCVTSSMSKIRFNIMQSDRGVCPEAVQLVHHFLLAANVVDLESQ